MQMTFSQTPLRRTTAPLMILGDAVRWALPLVTAAALSAAITSAASSSLDHTARSPTMVLTGDPAGVTLVPDVSRAPGR